MIVKDEKLVKKIFISGEIEVITGLHIGGSNASMSIGGMDNPVIRNPINDEPFIPGSSLKGKMRAMLEIKEGTFGTSNKTKFNATSNPNHTAARLFGYTGYENDMRNAVQHYEQQPSRLIVRDSSLTNKEVFTKTDLLYTESKMEVTIDRITSDANPRPIERVPAGAKFQLELVLNIFQSDIAENIVNKLIETTFKCLQLVQDDYLGGSGSRGSGQVAFVIHKVYEKDANYYSTPSSPEPPNQIADYQKFIPKEIRIKK